MLSRGTSAQTAKGCVHLVRLVLALISTGELLVVPMMQSLLGQLAPRSAFTTAFLFVAMSVGYTLGGWLGTLYERLSAVVFWGVCVGLAGVAVVGMSRLRVNHHGKNH